MSVLRSMETAPRDGTWVVLVYDDFSVMFPAFWGWSVGKDNFSWIALDGRDVGEGYISPDEVFCGWFECPFEIQGELTEGYNLRSVVRGIVARLECQREAK